MILGEVSDRIVYQELVVLKVRDETGALPFIQQVWRHPEAMR